MKVAFLVAFAAVTFGGVLCVRGARDPSLHPSPTFSCVGHKGEPVTASLNDDFCDCKDGSDEPGTSACVNSRFFCRNTGHIPREIPSSWVDDGVCDQDCCDGSDEPQGKCPNRCEELGRAGREARARELARYQEGLVKRAELAERGARERVVRAEELAKKRAELSSEEAREVTARAAKEAAEAADKARRDAEEEEKRKREAEEAALAFLKRQAEDRAAADAASAAAAAGTATPDAPSPDAAAAAAPSEPGLLSVTGSAISEAASWLKDSLAETLSSPPATVTELESARSAHDALTKSIENLRSEIKGLEESSEIDTAGNDALTALIDECVKYSDAKYDYEVCLFEKVTQSGTDLGHWKGWKEGSGHTVMVYEGGSHCWQAPARNTQVTLKCGPDTVLSQVEEPSRCAYTAVLETPAACSQQHYDALLLENA